MRILVLGVGNIGKTWLKEIAADPNCEVAGAVSKHVDLLNTVGEEVGIQPAKRFVSIEDGLERSGAQAVIVALPITAHCAAIVAALERGLHVLSEKPLAMDMTEAAAIVRAARRARGAVLMVDQNFRWRARSMTLRRAVRNGSIGRVISGSYEFRKNTRPPSTDEWREQMSHPLLHDSAIHHFDLLRAWTGQECTDVVAVPIASSWGFYRGLPAVAALLSFDQGLVVNYTASWVAQGFVTPPEGEGLVTLVGEGGTLRLEADQQVRWYRDDQVSVVPQEPMPVTDTTYALNEFLAAIREGRLPETHLEDNVRSLAMTAAAIESVEKHQPVAVSPLVAEALGG